MFVCTTRLGTDNRRCTSCPCVMGDWGGGVVYGVKYFQIS